VIPRTGAAEELLTTLAAVGVLLEPTPDRAGRSRPPVVVVANGVAPAPRADGSVVVAVGDLIAELERRAAADHPVPHAPRHLRLVPRTAQGTSIQ
jgi:hypothetical protein